MADVHIDHEQRAMLPRSGFMEIPLEHWLGAGRGELIVHRCRSCGTQFWPPSAACYHFQSMDIEWSPVSGTGRVFAFTWADYPIPADGVERNITVIELEGTTGPDPVRMISWVVDVGRDELACDLPVEVTFLPVDDEVSVPAWRPRR